MFLFPTSTNCKSSDTNLANPILSTETISKKTLIAEWEDVS